MNNLAGYNSVLGISSWVFNLVVGAIILLAMLLFLGIYADRMLKRKEYNGFCESCGKRLETSRYTIKLCEDCRMEEFDKSRESVSPTSQTSPNGDFSNEKEHNIS